MCATFNGIPEVRILFCVIYIQWGVAISPSWSIYLANKVFFIVEIYSWDSIRNREMLEGSLKFYQVPQNVLSSHPIFMATPIIAQTKNGSHWVCSPSHSFKKLPQKLHLCIWSLKHHWKYILILSWRFPFIIV